MKVRRHKSRLLKKSGKDSINVAETFSLQPADCATSRQKKSDSDSIFFFCSHKSRFYLDFDSSEEKSHPSRSGQLLYGKWTESFFSLSDDGPRMKQMVLTASASPARFQAGPTLHSVVFCPARICTHTYTHTRALL